MDQNQRVATADSAVILPFRRVDHATKPAPKPSIPAGAARLEAALASLRAALDEQQAAVADFRGAIGALHGAMTSLGEGVTGYQSRLGTLADQVTNLRTQAERLESIASIAATGPNPHGG